MNHYSKQRTDGASLPQNGGERDPVTGLTAREDALVKNLLSGMERWRAAEAAGYRGKDREALTRAAHKAVRRPRVREHLERLTRKVDAGDDPDLLDGREILKVVQEIAKQKQNRAAQLSAARFLFEVSQEARESRALGDAVAWLKAQRVLSERGIRWAEDVVATKEKGAAAVVARRRDEAEEIIAEAEKHAHADMA